ncbi:unnamed protein product [Discosporangium mesarthrocarpum]
MFEKFTEKALQVIMMSQEESRKMGHNFVGSEQLLLGLMGEGSGVANIALREYGIKIRDVRLEVERLIGRGTGFVAIEIPFTPRAKRILEMTVQQSKDLNHSYVGTEHLFLALLNDKEGISVKVLRNLGASISKVKLNVLRDMGQYTENSPKVVANVGAGDEREKARFGRIPRAKDLFLYNEMEDTILATPNLAEYTTDLTDSAKGSNLDPMVGRKNEIERVIQILARRRKNNPILIGEPGVGKTAVAEGLAQRIVQHEVPSELHESKVIVLDITLLLAGTKYRGEFEERLKRIVFEIKTQKDIIVVIDEVHTLVGAGAAEGALDAANILKPALARGELQCIGATTIDEYRQHIEKDPALERRFQPVWVNEPSIDETIQILRGLRLRYEQHHRLEIADDALEAAARLGAQYIPDRYLPDKAIDLMDEASSRVRLINYQIPTGVFFLDKSLRAILEEKDRAVREQRFPKAEELLGQETEIRARMAALINTAKIRKKEKEEKEEREKNEALQGKDKSVENTAEKTLADKIFEQVLKEDREAQELEKKNKENENKTVQGLENEEVQELENKENENEEVQELEDKENKNEDKQDKEIVISKKDDEEENKGLRGFGAVLRKWRWPKFKENIKDEEDVQKINSNSDNLTTEESNKTEEQQLVKSKENNDSSQINVVNKELEEKKEQQLLDSILNPKYADFFINPINEKQIFKEMELNPFIEKLRTLKKIRKAKSIKIKEKLTFTNNFDISNKKNAIGGIKIEEKSIFGTLVYNYQFIDFLEKYYNASLDEQKQLDQNQLTIEKFFKQTEEKNHYPTFKNINSQPGTILNLSTKQVKENEINYGIDWTDIIRTISDEEKDIEYYLDKPYETRIDYNNRIIFGKKDRELLNEIFQETYNIISNQKYLSTPENLLDEDILENLVDNIITDQKEFNNEFLFDYLLEEQEKFFKTQIEFDQEKSNKKIPEEQFSLLIVPESLNPQKIIEEARIIGKRPRFLKKSSRKKSRIRRKKHINRFLGKIFQFQINRNNRLFQKFASFQQFELLEKIKQFNKAWQNVEYQIKEQIEKSKINLKGNIEFLVTRQMEELIMLKVEDSVINEIYIQVREEIEKQVQEQIIVEHEEVKKSIEKRIMTEQDEVRDQIELPILQQLVEKVMQEKLLHEIKDEITQEIIEIVSIQLTKPIREQILQELTQQIVQKEESEEQLMERIDKKIIKEINEQLTEEIVEEIEQHIKTHITPTVVENEVREQIIEEYKTDSKERQLINFEKEQIDDFEEEQIDDFEEEQINDFEEQIDDFEEEQINDFEEEQIDDFEEEQIDDFEEEQIDDFEEEQIDDFEEEQIDDFEEEQIDDFEEEQIDSLDTEQIDSLEAEQIDSLEEEQKDNLTEEEQKRLEEEQRLKEEEQKRLEEEQRLKEEEQKRLEEEQKLKEQKWKNFRNYQWENFKEQVKTDSFVTENPEYKEFLLKLQNLNEDQYDLSGDDINEETLQNQQIIASQEEQTLEAKETYFNDLSIPIDENEDLSTTIIQTIYKSINSEILEEYNTFLEKQSTEKVSWEQFPYQKSSEQLEKEEKYMQRILAQEEKAKQEERDGTKGILTRLKVEAQDIASIVALWTGVPVTKITKDETTKLLEMENVLHTRVVGQSEAVSAVSRAIRRARVGMRSMKRPIASFFFSGPTGVGKTELTKTLATFFFGAEDAMVRLDMSEFMERHTVAKLIGAPPGYIGYNEGGQLTEAVRRKPYTVVLFDELEKAHPDVFNLLLQILEDGRLTDSKGRIVDFKNTILIMTSNLGSADIEQYNMSIDEKEDDSLDIGFNNAEKDQSIKLTQYAKLCAIVGESLKSFFKPEFLNRIDEIIVFQQLTKRDVKQIAIIMINDLVERVKKEKDINLTISEKMMEIIVDEGFDPKYGARPLRRAIVKLVEDKVSFEILRYIKENSETPLNILVDVEEGKHVKISITEIKPEPTIEIPQIEDGNFPIEKEEKKDSTYTGITIIEPTEEDYKRFA